jgi:hypothetical protein
MENRPTLQIALTSADKLVETLGWVGGYLQFGF